MDEREWNFRHAIVSAFVGLALSAITFWIATPSIDEASKLDAIATLLTGLLGAVLSMQILQSRELEKIRETVRTAGAANTQALGIVTVDLEKIRETVRTAGAATSRAFDIVTVNATLASKMHEVQHLPAVVADVAGHALQQAIDGVTIGKHGYSTKGRRLALLCYSRFWSQMVYQQNNSNTSMIGRLTHTADVKILTDDHAMALSGLHSQFTKKGALFRILVDRKALDAGRVKSYLDAIDEMDEIHCAYINVAEHPELLGRYPELEYCLVEGETNFCSEWKLDVSGDVMAHELTTLPLRYGRYLASWKRLIIHIRARDYHREPVLADHRKRLAKLKADFIYAYDLAEARAKQRHG